LVGDVEIVLVALRAGKRRRPGIDREIELALRHSARNDGHGKVRPDDAGQDVDLVRLDHLVGDLHGKLRLLAVIFGHDLDLGRRVAGILERQHETIARVDTQSRTAARKRRDHSDLDRLRKSRSRYAHGKRGKTRCNHFLHSPTPVVTWNPSRFATLEKSAGLRQLVSLLLLLGPYEPGKPRPSSRPAKRSGARAGTHWPCDRRARPGSRAGAIEQCREHLEPG